MTTYETFKEYVSNAYSADKVIDAAIIAGRAYNTMCKIRNFKERAIASKEYFTLERKLGIAF
jgi:hypothetical protein